MSDRGPVSVPGQRHPVSRQVLDSCLQTLGVAVDARADIALALTEACTNVIQHAGPGDEYEVLASTRDGRCVIEVVNTGNGFAAVAPGDEPVAPAAEHGRGLKIIDAVADNLRLTGNGRDVTTVHFEKRCSGYPARPVSSCSAAADSRRARRPGQGRLPGQEARDLKTQAAGIQPVSGLVLLSSAGEGDGLMVGALVQLAVADQDEDPRAEAAAAQAERSAHGQRQAVPERAAGNLRPRHEGPVRMLAERRAEGREARQRAGIKEALAARTA